MLTLFKINIKGKGLVVIKAVGVTAEYILFTLDDYFLTETIDSSKIERAVAVMEDENIEK